MDDKFRCICLCPVALGNAGLAIAAARAGGVGVLDFDFSERSALDQELVENLIDLTEGEVGIHLGRGGVEPLIHCLELLEQRPHWVLLSAETARENLPKLPPHKARTVLVELCDVEELALIDGLAVDGVVAKGHEAGGWVGEDTGFVLGQKLRAQTHLPFYVRGGVGFYTAAAWRAVGAAGVLLEEQLLLMPESALPRSWQQQLAKVTGQDTRAIGERLGQGCRVFVRPGHAAIDRLQQLVDDCETGKALRDQWRDQATTRVGWRHRSEQAWPIGQAIGFAAAFCARYQTTGRLVRAILEQSAEQIESARALRPLISGTPLAVSHRTQYPIVQGPMTRVSDTAEFADLVAQGGSLPFLALALMTGEQTLALLQRTKSLLGKRPWGVGLLGFVPKQLRDQQIAAVWKVKPGFALIAGGRPDQALEFERQGIPAYLHVPSPTLLSMFLEQGGRRFVFEGRECGGHVGPLTSLVLWESMIRVLLENVPKGAESTIHVLFAGGISDAVSAAMVSVISAALVERGMKVGVLMGTAYLFTQEIVAGAATVQGFQEQALACQRTVNLETGPGHATRCAVTPFAQEFYEERRRMLTQGRTGEEIRDRLEELNLGRLRIASKGKARLEDGGLTDVDQATQYRDGMYMIGQVATLKQGVTTIAELHRAVSVESLEVLNQARIPRKRTSGKPAPSNIAIIGIGTLLPGAGSAAAYWHNILHKVNTITEIPRSRWDWRLYFDENRNKRAQDERRNRDKIYSKWGGFLDEVPFDPLRFGIPPNSLKSIDPIQLLALEVVRRALEDAGYAEGDFDRENTSVILGAGGGLGDLGLQYGVRSEIPRFVGIAAAEVWARLPEWTEESFAGSLLNVIAGRIANRFNFGGLNLTVDAACASSLAAINLAVTELECGRSNVAIAGGVDTVQSPFGFLCFSMTQALSPRGRARTFDEHGDGIVISEGLAMVVLKRLTDAERDGDRIYAIIKAVAGSSDGKALGLTAPLPAGQMRALRRAYSKAGFSPSTLGLIEAHGTGTPVGDRAETETVVTTLKEANTPSKSCAMGSVKTLMGHTKATAGAAGLIKVALALHHKVLPAHAGVESPIAPIADEQSPVYLLKEARPWLAHPDYPRRGALSSFGFGGTNFHAVLEEYDREYRPNAESPGAFDWPHELLVWRAPDQESLERNIRGVIEAFEKGAQPRLRDLAYTLALRSKEQSGAACTLAVVAESTKQLVKLLREYVNATGTGARKPIPDIQQAKLVISGPDQMAFLFPGQGSQYPNMVREAVLFIRELREAVEHADRTLRPASEKLLSQYIYPPGPYGEAEERRNWASLTDTRVAQPAIGAVEAGLLEFTRRLGLKPAMTAGHSYGEYAALYAAGVISRDDFLLLSETRGRVMAQACSAGERGTMAAVIATRADVGPHLSRFTGVQIANHNASKQVVISGPEAQVQAALEALSAAGISGSLLPVAGAFHTAMVASAQEPLTRAITATSFAPPAISVYSNTTGQAYPADPRRIRALLNEHMLRPVEFVQQIEGMYGAGVRVFVEVGPKGVLTGLVGQILEGRDHLAVALDGQGGGLRGLLNAVATLWVAGVELDITRLFDGRRLLELDLNRLVQTARSAAIPSTAWYITGGGARAPSEGEVKTGSLPALTLETVRADRQARDEQPRVQSDQRVLPEHAEPATLPVFQVPTAAGPEWQGPIAIEAFNAYHETMRRFLALQDQVMGQVLGGVAAGQQPGLVLDVRHSPAPRQQQPGGNGQDSSPAHPLDALPNDKPEKAAAIPAPQTTAVQVSTLPVAPGFDLSMELLLEVVSERTGYPLEMLGVEQDLEAELGIDSIKRVEILGALQKRLPEALAGRIRERMESFTRVKTLKGIVAELGAAPVGSRKAEPNEQGRVGISGIPALGREELIGVLLEVVSERTGYPAEMLGVEQDLEAELGIDSIKRVEILGALQKRLPEALAGRIRERMESFTRVKSLKGIVAGLTEPGGGRRVNPAGTTEPVRELPRFIMEPTVEPLAPPERSGLSGLYLITRDTLGIAEEVASELSSRGAEAVIIEWRLLAEEGNLPVLLAELRKRKAHLSGIVHLAAFSSEGLAASFEEWREHNRRSVKCLFALLKHIGVDLQAAAEKPSVVAVSRAGGYFGRRGTVTVRDPSAGATLGLLKTLVAEWPGARARVLDFDDSLSAAGVAQCIADEIGSGHNVVEIGYPGGTRTVFRTVQSPFQKNTGGGVQPRPDWVVLITAGARGITHQVARELAQPGMKFIIVGRTPEPPPEPRDTADITEVAALRRLLAQAARDRGELPTPVAVERQITELLCAREIRANLAYLCDVGIHLEYQPVDVRDVQAFGPLIDDIYHRYGRIDAVLHGAGIIEDKLIIDKTLPSFEQVYDTKVDSTYTLSGRLQPESLELMVLFTSVAGRYGNRGQCDYAAANEVVNRLGWLLNEQWPKTRVIAINWGPWDTAGMASEGVKRQFRERGIVPISIPEGRRFFADELRYGRKEDVEVVVGVGPWQMLDMIPQKPPPLSKPNRPGSIAGLLRGQVPLVEPNGTVTFVHPFSSRSDPYLCDHRLDGKLVLPVAAAAEWLAQVVQAAWVDWCVTELRDLRVLKGFVLEEDTSKRALFRARPSSHSDPDGLSVSVEMLDPETKLAYYRGLAVLRSQLPEPPQVDFSVVTRGQRLEPAYAYREYLFHGDRFQLLEDIQALGLEGIDAVAVPSDPKRWIDGWQHVAHASAGSEFWIFDPGLLDTAPQLAIVWSRVMHDSTALPSCFGTVVRYANSQSSGPFKIAFRIHPKSDEHSLSYDAYFMGTDGRVCLELRDVESTCSPALNRLAANS